MFGREMADVFESYAGDASNMGEYVQKDFDALGAEGSVRYFVRAEHILQGHKKAAEEQDVCLHSCLGEARAREARLVAEGYLEREASEGFTMSKGHAMPNYSNGLLDMR